MTLARENPARGPTAVFVGPVGSPLVEAAVWRGGGCVVATSDTAAAIVWLDLHPGGIRQHLHDHVRWVQLPQAGVNRWLDAGVIDGRCVWTSAAGAFGPVVAERAVALLLAGVHRLHEHARATSWTRLATARLRGRRVLVVGTGAIGRCVASDLLPLGAEPVGMNRTGPPASGFEQVVSFDAWPEVCRTVDDVVLAVPVTPHTRGMVGGEALRALPATAVVVNVGRGELVDTEALITALREGHIAAAALDVTDPEPLPVDHPLWSEPRALITSHTANPQPDRTALLAAHVEENVRRWVIGEPLLSVIDPERGY